jgi:2-polyprenyl-3-methyl-5-hydroxy-6-metoxy-1,4-benzoquinol methylase
VDRGARRFDQSQLHVDRLTPGRTYVHRDYIAHALRWQHAVRFVKAGTTVLDVGCGQDQPMVSALCRTLATVPRRYVGVDLNPISRKTGVRWATVHDRFNFVDDWKKLARAHAGDAPRGFDLVTCFEVIEHMQRADGRKLLRGVRGLVHPEGTFLLSTPVYNGRHMAAAHLHEYRADELRAEVERAGFRVDRVVGTFMTSQALKRAATKEHRELADLLHRQWHSWELLACVFAPLYPAASSNCCWVLRPA